MAKAYRTAAGKTVDMDTLRLKNEDVIAVGNMKTNARGDQLGSGGQVVAKRNQIMDQHYRPRGPVITDRPHHVAQAQVKQGAKVSQGNIKKTEPKPSVKSTAVPELDPDGVPFDQSPIPEPQPKMRGSFADSIAKTATVKQELAQNPHEINKPKGPSRI